MAKEQSGWREGGIYKTSLEIPLKMKGDIQRYADKIGLDLIQLIRVWLNDRIEQEERKEEQPS